MIDQADIATFQGFEVGVGVDGLNVQDVQLNSIGFPDAEGLQWIASWGHGLKT